MTDKTDQTPETDAALQRRYLGIPAVVNADVSSSLELRLRAALEENTTLQDKFFRLEGAYKNCVEYIAASSRPDMERERVIEECAKKLDDEADHCMNGREMEWTRHLARKLRALAAQPKVKP